MKCIVLAVQSFYVTGFYPLVPYKKVAIKFDVNQELNLGNQYHKNAT